MKTLPAHQTAAAARARHRILHPRREGWSSWLVPLGVVAIGLPVAAWSLMPDVFKRGGAPKFVTADVIHGPFEHVILERGEINSSSSVEVRCQVQSRNSGGITILEIVPEGQRVKAGDLLIRLDDSSLQQELIQQQIVCSTSDSLVIEARADQEAARLALKEYEEGTFRESEELQESALFVAQENLRRAEEYLRYSEQLAERGYVSEVQLEADRFAVEKARKERDVANTRLNVLRTYSKKKMLTQLKAAIDTATARLESRTRTWELDKLRLKDIQTQIARCVITAPRDGQVVYANDPERRSSSGDLLIAEGKQVRERQVLIRLPDPGEISVVASVHESRINHMKKGLRAQITLDALPDQPLEGRVVSVSEYPMPSANIYTTHIKEYAVAIQIDAPPADLRPGMNAEVSLMVERLPAALLVPHQSIVGRDGRSFCGVPRADGSLETREVQVGTSNESHVVVTSGLNPGESVAMGLTEPEKVLDLPALAEPVARPLSADTPAVDSSKVSAPSAGKPVSHAQSAG